MAIKFQKYQNKNEDSKAYGKWYARPVKTDDVDLQGLAEHMAEHHSAFSAGVIAGVLTDMVKCIRELVLEGKAVKLPNLAIFQIGMNTTGADSPEKFTVKKNVARLYLRARGTGDFSSKEIKRIGSLSEDDEYSSPESEEDPEMPNP